MTTRDLTAIRERADAARQAAASGTTGLPPNVDGLSISEALDIFAESAEDVPWLLDEVERLRAERDQAREEVGHEKAMRRFVSEERDMFIDRMKCAEVAAARWKAAWDMAESLRTKRDRAREATIARVRTLADSWDDVIAVERHLHGDRSARLVADAQADLLAAIEGTDS